MSKDRRSVLSKSFSTTTNDVSKWTTIWPNPRKKAKQYTPKILKATWPELANTRPSRLSLDAVVQWAKKLNSEGANFAPPGAKIGRKGNSSSTINKTIQALTRIIDLAVAKVLAAVLIA